MAISIQITCDGEVCRRRENARLRDPHVQPAQHSAHATIVWAHHHDHPIDAIHDTRHWLIVDPDWFRLPDDWAVERVPRDVRYPQGLRFLCGECSDE